MPGDVSLGCVIRARTKRHKNLHARKTKCDTHKPTTTPHGRCVFNYFRTWQANRVSASNSIKRLIESWKWWHDTLSSPLFCPAQIYHQSDTFCCWPEPQSKNTSLLLTTRNTQAYIYNIYIERQKERLPHKSDTQCRERDFCVERRVLISGFNQQITRRHSPMTHNCPVGAEIFGGEIETIDRKPKALFALVLLITKGRAWKNACGGGTFTCVHASAQEKAARTSEMAQKPN